jgi:hypothetical protein
VSIERGRYAIVVYALSLIGAGCVALIVLGEILGGPDRRVFWQIGGAGLGGILVVYGLILLLLRKMGLLGPRRAER